MQTKKTEGKCLLLSAPGVWHEDCPQTSGTPHFESPFTEPGVHPQTQVLTTHLFLELTNFINKMKNALKCIGNRGDQIEERISELENKNLEMIQV